jgi:hypothetical protein
MTESFKEKIKDHFADTICEGLEQLTGEEVFECFRNAVTEHRIYTTKEYEKAKLLSEHTSFIGVGTIP